MKNVFLLGITLSCLLVAQSAFAIVQLVPSDLEAKDPYVIEEQTEILEFITNIDNTLEDKYCFINGFNKFIKGKLGLTVGIITVSETVETRKTYWFKTIYDQIDRKTEFSFVRDEGDELLYSVECKTTTKKNWK